MVLGSYSSSRLHLDLVFKNLVLSFTMLNLTLGFGQQGQQFIGATSRSRPRSMFPFTSSTNRSECPVGCPKSCNAEGECRVCSRPGRELPLCEKFCSEGHYGMHCEDKCSSACRDKLCHPETGVCVHCDKPGYLLPQCTVPCHPGTYGLDCSLRCPLVCTKSCEPANGKCIHCEQGLGPHCAVNCADSKEIKTCQRYCPEKCVGSCNTSDGQCSLCAPGLKPPFCKEKCGLGVFGTNCEHACPTRCRNKKCDPLNGQCTEGCEAGFVGERCNGQCINGFFGDGCSQRCPETCVGNQCDFRHGHCIQCLPGFTGALCQELCPDGKHGINCQDKCPTNCGSQCDPVTGLCWMCLPGWRGSLCNETCLEGQFGLQCFNQCSIHCLDMICHPVNGECFDCEENRQGAYCIDFVLSYDSIDLTVPWLVFVGIACPGVVIAAGLCLLKCKTIKTGRKYAKEKMALERSMTEMKQVVNSEPEIDNGINEPVIQSTSSGRNAKSRKLDNSKPNINFSLPTTYVTQEALSHNSPNEDREREINNRTTRRFASVHSKTQFPGIVEFMKRFAYTGSNSVGASSSESSTLREVIQSSARASSDTCPPRTSRSYPDSRSTDSAVTFSGPDLVSGTTTEGGQLMSKTGKANRSIFKMHMACDVRHHIPTKIRTTATTTIFTSKSHHSSDMIGPRKQCKGTRTTMSASARLKGSSTSHMKMNATLSGTANGSVDSMYGIKSTEFSTTSASVALPNVDHEGSSTYGIRPPEDNPAMSSAGNSVGTPSIVVHTPEQQSFLFSEPVVLTGDTIPCHMSSNTESQLPIKLRPTSDTGIPQQQVHQGSTIISSRSQEMCKCIVPAPGMFSDDVSGFEQSETVSTFPYGALEQGSEPCASSLSEPVECMVKITDLSRSTMSIAGSEKSDSLQNDLFNASLDPKVRFLNSGPSKYEDSDQSGLDKTHFREQIFSTVDRDSEVKAADFSPPRPMRWEEPSRTNEASADGQAPVHVATSTGDLYSSYLGEPRPQSQQTESAAVLSTQPEVAMAWTQATPPESNMVIRCPLTRQPSPLLTKMTLVQPRALPTPPPGARQFLHPVRRPSNTSESSASSSDRRGTS